MYSEIEFKETKYIMPRASVPTGKPSGRPSISKNIDWVRVDELLMAGCTGTEIAATLGMHADTFYLRCQEENGMVFSAYKEEKFNLGDSFLKEVQYKKALGLTDKGDNTLLIWLGKTRLKQKEEKGDVILDQQAAAHVMAVMEQMSKLQKKDTDDTAVQSETT